MFGYDPETVYQDADIEMMELAERGNAIARAERAGRCTHQSLRGLTCTAGCGRTFRSDDEWLDAMEAAING